MRTITKEVYLFKELSDEAKEKAREWYREGNLDYDWWDTAFDDFVTIGNLLGIEFDTKPVKLMGGGTRYDPCIYFSGFYSQGDGACFEGRYNYNKGALKKVKEYTPQDKVLHEIAQSLQEIQKLNFYQAWAHSKHRGHYNHSYSMSIDCGRFDDKEIVGEDDLIQCMRDFADWMYHQLEKESEWLNSDEVVDDVIIANEYEFYEDGERV